MMRQVIKLGGTLLESPASRDRLAAEIAAECRRNHTVVVHGGGRQMTRFLEERGVQSRFLDGLRVSTPEVIDAILKVIAGTVNTELVLALNRAGARAVGLTGLDASLVEAVRTRVELEAVGEPRKCNGELLDLLIQSFYIPVVACVAGNRNDGILNVNADRMAVACAAGIQADRLLFLTDVAGVRGADGATIADLSSAAARQLIASGVAQGGMQAKLEAAQWALDQGVREVWIGPGFEPGLLEHLHAGEGLGTVFHH
jgi:acetylglutamate kinase